VLQQAAVCGAPHSESPAVSSLLQQAAAATASTERRLAAWLAAGCKCRDVHDLNPNGLVSPGLAPNARDDVAAGNLMLQF